MQIYTEAVIRASVTVAAFAAIIFSTHYRRFLIARKFSELFPGVKPKRRAAFFYNIDPRSAPDDDGERVFRTYMRKTLVYNLYIVLGSVAVMALALKL